MLFDVVCPACGARLKVAVDMSEGIPSETGTECSNCGAIPVFKVDWEPRIWIDGFKYYERQPKAAEQNAKRTGDSYAVGKVDSENYIRWKNGELPQEPTSW